MPPTGAFALLALRATENAAAAAFTSHTNSTDQLLNTTAGGGTGGEPGHREWNGGSVVPVAVISAVLSTAFVAMRFYTRIYILRSVKWEDWFILMSLLFAIATSGGMIAQLNYGLGHHLRSVGASFPVYIQTGILTNLFYSISLTLTKISILLLYIRILTYDLVRLLGKVLLGLVILTHTWIIASILTTCIPLSAAWSYDPANPPIYCHPVPVFWLNAVLHILTDFMIFMLPLPVISSMSLPRKQKTGLYFVFCLAFLVCAISTLRLVAVFHTDESNAQVADVTWSAVRVANWTSLEVHIAIVTACLTTLKPLLNALFPNHACGAPVNDSPLPLKTASPAEEARRRKDFEENFSTGDVDGYRRPLTIGTKSNRPKVRRDTFASLVADRKSTLEHLEVATPTSATKLSDKEGEEFKLPEVQPPSPFGRFSSWTRGSRLQIPGVTRGASVKHERFGSTATTRGRHERFPSNVTWASTHRRYESIDEEVPQVPGRRLI
ncbi:hypothetical protein COL26b_009273 [Colletotrichum chrysophilum]|uniref:uncharacterized protein n=1 Tax=Colletotrichum chrysophilum TaxID=1836956 RepID=UPI0023004325|nr:uncharacterized protein COL26b_009273 [Colletotrichum chrysophilum]KAJ0372116.1 hypothetical protein COL26b_009273 [Colletotrichum chrysophilum]